LAVPGNDRPLSLPAATLWATALWLLEHICFEVTESARPGAITDIVNVSACVVLATSIIVFAMLRVHAPHESVRAGFAAKRSCFPLRSKLQSWPHCSFGL